MAIDPSIYGNVKTDPINLPSPLSIAQQQQSLASLGLQNMQTLQAIRTQGAMRQAFANNVDENGNLNQQGFLSDLGKVNPVAAMEYGKQFNEMAKSQADLQSARLDAAQKTLSITGPRFEYMNSMSPDQRAQAWPQMLQDLKSQGVDISRMDHPYDPQMFDQYFNTWRQSKPSLENQVSQAQIGKSLAETAETQGKTAMQPGQMQGQQLQNVKTSNEIANQPAQAQLTQAEIRAKNAEVPKTQAEIQATLYGTRGANAELTSQYDKQAQPIRSSQIAMQQMIDNYNHPSPQGDASLILNAFKIKFPNAPDVNSLEELSQSQAATDKWKQIANHALSGGLDQNTRDNLMRDAGSTFRANVTSLRGIQQRYQARQNQQGVYDPTMTAEPAIDQTYKNSNAIQKQIGPYVPPPERGGIMSDIGKSVSNFLGIKGSNSSNQPQQIQSQAPQYRASGSKVSGSEVSQYAIKHNMKLSDAQKFLRSQGYDVGN